MKNVWRALGAAVWAIPVIVAPVLGATPSPGAHHGLPSPPNLSSPAAELRVDLDRLLAEHAFLTIEQMRSGLVDGPDFEAAAAAVEANSTEVSAAIGSIYGAAAVDPFGDIWRSHIGYLVDYAIAIGGNDATAQRTALDGLVVYRQRLADFLTEANPGVALDPIVESLDMHTAQLVEFIRAEDAGDHAGAYAIERQAYPHMFEVGDALARVIANRFPERYSGVDIAYSAAGTLRVTLDRVLAEHAFLAAEAMRSGVGGAADYEASLAAIAGNSDDLEGLIAAAYGSEAATSFRRLWDGHLAGYTEYIDAARANDPEARANATAAVSDYADRLAAFLADANPHLDAGALSSLFRAHAEHLTGQVEAFAAEDYQTTYELVRTGYRHMFDAGEALAIGIATQLPGKFPADAAAPSTDTDAHGAHGAGAGVGAWVLLIALGLVAVILRRRATVARGVRLGIGRD